MSEEKGKVVTMDGKPVGGDGACPWKPGDVVALKSGGPAMTVNDIEEDGDAVFVMCVWIVATGQPYEWSFSADALRKSP